MPPSTLDWRSAFRPPTSREETQRLRSYKRIADIKDEAGATKVIDELTDRYGPVPDEVRNLVQFSVLKSLAERIGVESVDRRQGYLNIKFHPQSKVDPHQVDDAGANGVRVRSSRRPVCLRLPVATGLSPEALLAHVQERPAPTDE